MLFFQIDPKIRNSSLSHPLGWLSPTFPIKNWDGLSNSPRIFGFILKTKPRTFEIRTQLGQVTTFWPFWSSQRHFGANFVNKNTFYTYLLWFILIYYHLLSLFIIIYSVLVYFVTTFLLAPLWFFLEFETARVVSVLCHLMQHSCKPGCSVLSGCLRIAVLMLRSPLLR